MTEPAARRTSIRLLLAPALMAAVWTTAAVGPSGTLAIDYPPNPYPSAAPTPTGTPTPPAAPMSLQVETRTSATLGAYLVGPNGFTLYTLSSDPANASSCDGSCAGAWPPLLVAQGGTATGGSGVGGTVGTFARTDGSTQVSHDGRALYAFSGDTASGETNGDGIVSFGGTWHVARPTAAAPSPAGVRIVGGNWNSAGQRQPRTGLER